VPRLLDYAPLIGPAIGWLVLIAGWFVVSLGNDKRETRKEMRALLNVIHDTVAKLECQAYLYYQKAHEESREIGMNIRRDFGRLGDMVATLKKAVSFDVNAELVAFRQKVTGGDFESAARQSRVPTDYFFPEVSAAALALTGKLEEVFYSKY